MGLYPISIRHFRFNNIEKVWFVVKKKTPYRIKKSYTCFHSSQVQSIPVLRNSTFGLLFLLKYDFSNWISVRNKNDITEFS